MKKRIFSLILALIMLFSVASCSRGELQTASETETNEEAYQGGDLFGDDEGIFGDDESGSGGDFSGGFFSDEGGDPFAPESSGTGSSKKAKEVDPLKAVADASKPITPRQVVTHPGVQGSMKVGFARASFTPTAEDGGTPMGGYGNADHRLSSQVLDDVQATCIAYQDGTGNIALMFTLDLISTNRTVSDKSRNVIRKLLPQIPNENIFFSCTHTHSAPTVNNASDWRGTNASVNNWVSSTSYDINTLSTFYKAIGRAAVDAVNDLAPADASYSKVNVPKMNFIRRYVDAQGNFLGTNTLNGSATATYETMPDTSLQILKFYRDNKKPVVLINWQAHPCYDSGETITKVSASYIHHLRATVENEGCHCAFFQGAAGNLITSTLISADKSYVKSTSKAYGEALAAYVKQGLVETRAISLGNIKTSWYDYAAPIDTSQNNRWQDAKKVYDLINAGKMDEARAKAIELGFKDMYDARDIYNKYIKSKSGSTEKLQLAALRIGDLGFVFPCYEMFDTNGMYVKNNSNCKLTFVCELSNEGHSYIPTEAAMNHGGYEATSCYYVKDTGDKLAVQLTAMLNSLK